MSKRGIYILFIFIILGQICVSQVCNPSLQSIECVTNTCCGSNGYCTADNCHNVNPPLIVHNEYVEKKDLGYWVQIAAGIAGVILAVVLILWFLFRCMSKY